MKVLKIGLLFCAGVVALVGLLWLLASLGKEADPAEIDALIANYTAAPDPAAADRLARLIENRRLSGFQGQQALDALLNPTVTVKPAYAEGESTKIRFDIPLPIQFRKVPYEHSEHVVSEGGSGGGSSSGSRGTLYYGTQFVDCGSSGGDSRVWKRSVNRTLKIGPYQWSASIPVDLNIISKKQAETIALAADPQLDRKMVECFSCAPDGAVASTRSDIHSMASLEGALTISYAALPADVALTAEFVTPDGQRKSFETFWLLARAGSSGSVRILPALLDLGNGRPGQIAGSVVLSPSRELACSDPAIKSIWGGKLEFPFTFTMERRR